MFLSQTKAAELAGVSRGTIANRIKDGKLSETPDGIDVAELVRVFKNITPDDIAAISDPDNRRELASKKPASAGDDMTTTEKMLHEQLAYVQERLEKADQRLADREDWFTQQMDSQREDHRAEVNTLTALLTAPKKKKLREKFWELMTSKTESAETLTN